jgi:hypothetical protein
MSALGHLGRAVANGLLALLAYATVSLLVLDGTDWRGAATFAAGFAVVALGFSVWQAR